MHFILSEHFSPISVELDLSICDKNASRLLQTSGFNVKVLKINLTAFCFYNFQMSTVTASGNELSLKMSMPYRG